MIRTISLMSAAVVLLLASASPSLYAKTVVRVGISAEPYPPFTYKSPDGSWKGFEIDLQKAICAKAGVTCKTVPTAWTGIIPALRIGKIDAIMNSMTITKTREKVINFTHPYYVSKLEWVGPKPLKASLPGGLKGELVGVQAGTQMAIFAAKKLTPIGVKVKLYNQQFQLSDDLLAGRIVAMLADNVYTSGFVKKNPSMEDKGTADWPVQYKGIALRKNETALEGKLNSGIEAVLTDGTCERLSKKYLKMNLCAKP